MGLQIMEIITRVNQQFRQGFLQRLLARRTPAGSETGS
jgi:hypothetical protein